MQRPAELRELAAYHRRVAKTATKDGEIWRLKLAEYLENLADETEKAAAKLVPIDDATRGKRIGVAKGQFELPDDIDFDNALIEKLFTGKTK